MFLWTVERFSLKTIWIYGERKHISFEKHRLNLGHEHVSNDSVLGERFCSQATQHGFKLTTSQPWAKSWCEFLSRVGWSELCRLIPVWSSVDSRDGHKLTDVRSVNTDARRRGEGRSVWNEPFGIPRQHPKASLILSLDVLSTSFHRPVMLCVKCGLHFRCTSVTMRLMSMISVRTRIMC